MKRRKSLKKSQKSHSPTPKTPSHPLCFIIPLIAGLIFFVLSVINLQLPVWFDESYTAYLTRGSFSDIWQLTSIDVHPPLYYFLLKIWATLFGSTDFTLRFMSIFFGIIGIIFTFQLVRRLFHNVRIASFATIAVAFSPILLRYGQEMRMYTLVFAIVAAASYILIRAIDTARFRYWLLYGIFVALGMWTHYFTVLVWFAQFIYLLWYYRKRIFQKNIIFSYILAVLLFIPWLPSFIHQMLDVEGGFWIGPINLATPFSFLSDSLIFAEATEAESWLAVLALVAIIFVLYFVCKLFRSDFLKTSRHPYFLLVLIILPPTVLFFLSLPPFRPLFMDRYVIYSSILIWCLIGLILAYLWAKPTPSLESKTHSPATPSSRSQSTSKSSSSKSASHLPAASYLNHPRLPALLFTILAAASAIVGIIRVETRAPESRVKEIVVITDTIASSNEPILARNYAIFYDAVMYSSDEHPIYSVDTWNTYQWGSLEPIRQIGYNLITDFSDFLAKNERFWLIVDNNKKGRNLPKELADYRIVTEASTEKHLALELEKDV